MILEKKFRIDLIILQVIKLYTILNFIVSLTILNIFGVIVNLTFVRIALIFLKD